MLERLDEVIAKRSKMLFQRNLINHTPKSALQLAKNNQASNKLQEERLRALRAHNGENANGNQCHVPSE